MARDTTVQQWGGGAADGALAEAAPQCSDWDLEDDEPDVVERGCDEESLAMEAKHAVESYRGCILREPAGTKIDALEWWKIHTGRYPRVEALARRRLSTQASSATSERSFSKSGRIVKKERMSLTPTHVDQLSLLAWNDTSLY